MAILTRIALAALLLAAPGCQRSPTVFELTERSISVHAVLVAGSDSATVLLTRPTETADQWDPSGTLPVTNAHVRLVHGADTLAASGTRSCRLTFFTGESATDGCYAAHVPGGVLAGGTYELLVDIAGGAPIYGSTRVPSPPQVLEPSASAEPPHLRVRQRTQPATALPVRWSVADAAARTELRFVPDRDDCFAFIARPGRSVGSEHIDVTGVDTATVTAAAVQCGAPAAESYTARFVVTVYDVSYTRYRERLGATSQQSRTSVGITGAFGVFGAAASSAVPVVLITQ